MLLKIYRDLVTLNACLKSFKVKIVNKKESEFEWCLTQFLCLTKSLPIFDDVVNALVFTSVRRLRPTAADI